MLVNGRVNAPAQTAICNGSGVMAGGPPYEAKSVQNPINKVSEVPDRYSINPSADSLVPM
jgi:hypothetical protein